MKKDLLITHTDLDGISPIILLNLTNRKFEYKNIEIHEVNDTFNELFASDLSIYENIYVTDLTLTEEVYKQIKEKELTVKVFDHHETHLFAESYPNVTVKVNLNGRQTCGTELFFEYLKTLYPELNKPIVADYVEQVRQLDTFTFESDLPRHIETIRETIGKLDFIKSFTKRLKKDKEHIELTAFEKRFVKLKAEELLRYMQKKENKMFRYNIDGKICGVVFSENNKSELGNYLSNKYPELDLIILIDASSRISYRTSRDDVAVNEFASTYGGGGHRKASGSSFDDEMRKKVIELYYNDAKCLDEEI